MTMNMLRIQTAEGWREGEGSSARSEASTVEVRSDRTLTIEYGCRSTARTLVSAALAGVFFASPGALPAAAANVLLREEFTSLDGWRPLTFPKIERHSTYTIAADAERTESWLRAESDRSASGLVWKRTFDVREYPILRWRWRVENVYRNGDATRKAGDDYPLRVYVIFAYDPAGASTGRRLKYGIAKAIYGEYPPDSGLNYVWESRENSSAFVVSPYTDAMMMFLTERGAGKVGQWVEEQVDVLADYRRAFGKDPPHVASLAVMNDSDNTGEKSVSYLDWIEIAR